MRNSRQSPSVKNSAGYTQGKHQTHHAKSLRSNMLAHKQTNPISVSPGSVCALQGEARKPVLARGCHRRWGCAACARRGRCRTARRSPPPRWSPCLQQQFWEMLVKAFRQRLSPIMQGYHNTGSLHGSETACGSMPRELCITIYQGPERALHHNFRGQKAIMSSQQSSDRDSRDRLTHPTRSQH